MSFLDKETKEGEPEKKSAFWDWVVGIVIVGAVGGFTFYYQFQKKSSVAAFQAADALYQGHQYKQAAVAYEELKAAQYLTNQNDSVISARLDTIELLGEHEADLIKDAKTRLAANDSAG